MPYEHHIYKCRLLKVEAQLVSLITNIETISSTPLTQQTQSILNQINNIRYEKNKKGELKPLIEFTQVKTEKVMTIPLHSKIIEIMQKYDGNFPRKISDQRYNEHIKKVCEAAEINQPTHGTLFDHKIKEKVTKDFFEEMNY